MKFWVIIVAQSSHPPEAFSQPCDVAVVRHLGKLPAASRVAVWAPTPHLDEHKHSNGTSDELGVCPFQEGYADFSQRTGTLINS